MPWAEEQAVPSFLDSREPVALLGSLLLQQRVLVLVTVLVLSWDLPVLRLLGVSV